MIRPDDVANGCSHPGLERQARGLQSLWSPVKVESQILDALQHFFREPYFWCLWVPEDQERAFTIRSDERAGKRRCDSFPLFYEAQIDIGMPPQSFQDHIAIKIITKRIACQPHPHAHLRQPDCCVRSHAASMITVRYRKNCVLRRGQTVCLNDIIHADLTVT